MNKKTKIIISALIIILALGVWAGWYYWWRLEPVREAYKIHETELALLKSDTVGGDTPEQTWQMFLTALRNEDLDLASKYFVLEKQEEWRKNLEKIKENNMLGEMIDDLSGAELESEGENIAQFRYEGEDSKGNLTWATVNLEKNINHKWKIRSF